MLNKVLPESVSTLLVRLAQPNRDINGHQAKFPAFYKLCGSPSARLARTFEELGYVVVEHSGFVGHSYYERFPVLRDIERISRPYVAAANLPIVSGVLLRLRRPG